MTKKSWPPLRTWSSWSRPTAGSPYRPRTWSTASGSRSSLFLQMKNWWLKLTLRLLDPKLSDTTRRLFKLFLFQVWTDIFCKKQLFTVIVIRSHLWNKVYRELLFFGNLMNGAKMDPFEAVCFRLLRVAKCRVRVTELEMKRNSACIEQAKN